MKLRKKNSTRLSNVVTTTTNVWGLRKNIVYNSLCSHLICLHVLFFLEKKISSSHRYDIISNIGLIHFLFFFLFSKSIPEEEEDKSMPHTYACCFWKTKTQVISRSFLFYLEVPIIITTRQNNNNSFIDEWINFFSIQFNLKPIIMIKREDENKTTKKREPENRIPHWMNEWI